MPHFIRFDWLLTSDILSQCEAILTPFLWLSHVYFSHKQETPSASWTSAHWVWIQCTGVTCSCCLGNHSHRPYDYSYPCPWKVSYMTCESYHVGNSNECTITGDSWDYSYLYNFSNSNSMNKLNHAFKPWKSLSYMYST